MALDREEVVGLVHDLRVLVGERQVVVILHPVNQVVRAEHVAEPLEVVPGHGLDSLPLDLKRPAELPRCCCGIGSIARPRCRSRRSGAG